MASAYPAGLPFTAATVADSPSVTTDEAYWLSRVAKPISDALDGYLYGDGYLNTAGRGWIPLTYSGTWTYYGSTYRLGAYRTRGDVVELRGLVKGGAGVGAGNPIATGLPAPPFQRQFVGMASPNNTATLILTTAGVLYVGANLTGADATAFVSLEAVTYFTS